APLVFLLALAFLLLVAGLAHRANDPGTTESEKVVFRWGLLVLWPILAVEAWLRVLARTRSETAGPHARRALLICLLPPLRMGAPGVTRPGEVWLPFAGWKPVGKELRQRLERSFSLPMIGIALLTLPLLAVEYFYEQQIKETPLLALLLQVGVSVIWVAFAFELVLMVSVAQRKGRFLLEHWI